MTVPIHEWGRRLSDALRASIESGDLVSARRLAIEGDGQARSLAKEYTFMHRGLGITIKVMLPLLAGAVARRDGDSVAAASDLTSLIHRFRSDLEDIGSRRLAGPRSSPEPPRGLQEEIVRAARALDEIQALFEREQARVAEDVLRAIDAQQVARALELLDVKERSQYLPLHDRLLRFMADSFGWVLQRYGPDELLRFHLDTAEGQRAGFEKWEAMSAAEFAWTSAFLLKQHMGNLTVSEDEEKFTIQQGLCGSGGRLQLQGAYAGPGALPFLTVPGPLTFGEPRLPVYCSHCAIWNGVATLRWFGRAHWVFDRPARPDGGCTLHIYKRHDGTPPGYRARLALRGEA